jgi:alpha-D-ribose 1-methylphosphonate 5-phosphate C-P lyase
MDELPQADGSSRYRISDSGYVEKLIAHLKNELTAIGPTYYDTNGRFYRDDVIKQLS